MLNRFHASFYFYFTLQGETRLALNYFSPEDPPTPQKEKTTS